MGIKEMIYSKKQLKELRVRVTEIMNSMEKGYMPQMITYKGQQTDRVVVKSREMVRPSVQDDQ